VDSPAIYQQPFFLPPFFQWLLHTSWQAGILVCLILLIQKALGRRIGVRGCYWLWLVVLIRMVMPWAPPSAVSMYNLLPPPRLASHGLAATAQSGNVGPAFAAMDGTFVMGGHGKAGPAANETQETQAATGPGLWARRWLERQDTVLFLLWLAGVCALTGYILAGHIRLWRIVRRECPLTDRRILDLLDKCHRQLGIGRAVGVIATDRVGSPALFGFLRPRLLLPRATMAELNLCELRHIFLHELAHLRRDDIVIGYLVTLLQVLHWFNPLIALGFRRMRADWELVCDGLALSMLTPDETAAYGRTIVHQIEQLLTSRPRRMLAALSGDRARIKQRIAMISQFTKGMYRRSPLAIVLIGLLACTGLTNGLPVYKFPVYEPARDVPTTHQDKHANIVRIHVRHRDTAKYLMVRGETVTCDANEPGDTGLWEARFDDDFGQADQIVYFYSVATCKYLTSDNQGNVAANGLEPNEAARWSVRNRGESAWIVSCRFEHTYLRRGEQGEVMTAYGTGASRQWEIDQVWRIKVSDRPVSNPQWRRQFIPGPDWGPPWSLVNRKK